MLEQIHFTLCNYDITLRKQRSDLIKYPPKHPLRHGHYDNVKRVLFCNLRNTGNHSSPDLRSSSQDIIQFVVILTVCAKLPFLRRLAPSSCDISVDHGQRPSVAGVAESTASGARAFHRGCWLLLCTAKANTFIGRRR